MSFLLLIFQTNNLQMVHRGVKFSCRFTLKEVAQRWYALLYDPTISRLAVSAMRNLHPESIANIESKALFSVAEEELLATIQSVCSMLIFKHIFFCFIIISFVIEFTTHN